MDSVDYLENISRTGGVVTMCAVAEALKTEGKREGILEGKVEILLEMNFAVAEIANRLGISIEDVNEIIDRM